MKILNSPVQTFLFYIHVLCSVQGGRGLRIYFGTDMPIEFQKYTHLYIEEIWIPDPFMFLCTQLWPFHMIFWKFSERMMVLLMDALDQCQIIHLFIYFTSRFQFVTQSYIWQLKRQPFPVARLYILLCRKLPHPVVHACSVTIPVSTLLNFHLWLDFSDIVYT